MTDGPGSSAGDVVGGRYRLEGELGRGGMAVVWRATDLKLDRTVAVKVFRSEVAEAVDPQRTTRETRLLAGMRHPAVVGALDASRGDADVTYLVMELVEGDDLKTLLRGGALDPDLARRVIADVADALALLHSRGVVHRDVKPANILVVREPERRATGVTAKLTDFGIAQAVDGTRITAADAILGTAAYLSPEQVRGEPVGPPSDVYAAGLVLAECLSGRRAFPGPPPESAVARLTSAPPVPPGASAELAALVVAMTAMHPADRPAAAAVAATLRDLAGSMTEPEEADTALVPGAAPSLLAATPAIADARPADADLAVFEETDGLDAAPRRRPLLVPAIAAAVIGVLGGTGVLLSSPLLFGDGLLPHHVAAASGAAVAPGDAVSAGTDTPLPTSPATTRPSPRPTRSTVSPVAATGASDASSSSPDRSSAAPSGGTSSAPPSSAPPSPSVGPSSPPPSPSASASPTPTPTQTPTPTSPTPTSPTPTASATPDPSPTTGEASPGT